MSEPLQANRVMARPRRYLVRMLLCLIAILIAGAVLFQPLSVGFMTNAPLNGFILGVFALGIVYNFRQVLMLYPEVAWIEGFRDTRAVVSQIRPPRLLAPMATMMRERRDRLTLSTMAMRSLLDGISSRLDESRDLSRYNIGLLIFLGLLGTFWGLMHTVASIRDVIAGLSLGGDASQVFQNLKQALDSPLSGMGTAFSTSLFGLGGSLVLGFLDLQATQAQNRFFNDLEEWLSSVTRLSSGSVAFEGDQSVPAYVQALLEQTADSLENLQRTLARGEESRIAVNVNLKKLGENLGTLTDHMRTEQTLMKTMAEAQVEMKPILALLAAPRPAAAGALDEATRSHIRNLDIQIGRLADELRLGRQDLVQQMRSEFKLLARTMAALAGEGER